MSRVSIYRAPASRASLSFAALAAGVALVAGVFGLLTSTLTAASVALVLSALAGAILFALRRDDLTAALLIGVLLLVDWYQLFGVPLGYPIVGPLLTIAVVAGLFLTQASERPWITVPQLWFWGILLALAAISIPRGISPSDSILYYIGVFVTPLLMYLLGTQWARDLTQMRRLLIALAAVGTLVALQTIFAGATGIFLLSTPRQAAYLSAASNFTLAGSADPRVGSFLGNPDWNGAFLAMMLFVPIGLLIAARTRFARACYLGETIVILVGLLYTYSTAAWLAAAIGFLVLIVLVGRGLMRFYMAAIAVVALGALSITFPAQIRGLALHALEFKTVTLRVGAWLTSLRVIAANPIWGVGLGLNTYLKRAEPFRVALQTRPLAHPHDSYLELAALAGLPLLVIFLMLLTGALSRALGTLRQAPRQHVALLGGALTALLVLSVNSLAINGWTLAPLAAIAWLMLGGLASPGLRQSLQTREGDTFDLWAERPETIHPNAVMINEMTIETITETIIETINESTAETVTESTTETTTHFIPTDTFPTLRVPGTSP